MLKFPKAVLDSVIIKQALPLLAGPDASLPASGTVSAGRYATDRQHSSDAMEYAHIPGRGWVRTRNDTDVFGVVDLMRHPSVRYLAENQLITNLARFRNYTYAPKIPGTKKREKKRFPGPIETFIGKQSGPEYTDCVCFLAWLLAASWQTLGTKTFPWRKEDHGAFLLYKDPDKDAEEQRYGNIRTMVRKGMGVQLESDAFPAPWTLVQGWRGKSPGSGGHLFLVLDSDPTTRAVLTLESNFAYGISGVGFRNFGDVKDFEWMHPGRNWVEHAVATDTTWDEIMRTYPYRRQALLRVAPVGWIRKGPDRDYPADGALESDGGFESAQDPDRGAGIFVDTHLEVPDNPVAPTP